MREIKFRGWNKLQKIMIANPVLPSGWLNDMFVDDAGEHAGTTYMQYTGLKDVEGVEIYEGDIVQDEDGNNYEIRYFGDKDYPAFDTYPEIDYNSNGLNNMHETGVCEVIGNIYENPELLTQKEK